MTRLTSQQLQSHPSDKLKQEAKLLFDVIYARPTGARPSTADVEEFDAIRLELLSRGFKMKRINTIYFCECE